MVYQAAMASVAQQIHTALKALNPTALQVMDDSAKHAGHAGARAGGESHFTVHIVSELFAGQSRVARHRMVYEKLQPLFEAGLHALAIDAKAPGEA